MTVAGDDPSCWVGREAFRPPKETREAAVIGDGTETRGPSLQGALSARPAGWRCADTELSGGFGRRPRSQAATRAARTFYVLLPTA